MRLLLFSAGTLLLGATLCLAELPPAFQALRRGDAVLLRSLLREGGNPNLRLPNGTTLLMEAAKWHDEPLARMLIEGGADPNGTNEDGATALLWGAGHAGITAYLLEQGADPLTRSRLGNRALTAAVSYPEGEEAVSLLRAAETALAGKVDFDGLLPRAVSGGNPVVFAWLVEKSSKKDLNGALYRAAARGSREQVMRLLELGADPNQSEGGRGHALHSALLTGHPGIAVDLVEAGADVNLPTPQGSVPPVMLSVYGEFEDESVLDLLVARGVRLGAANARGETALTWARRSGHPGLAARLAAAGVDEGVAKTKIIPNRDIEWESADEPGRLREAAGRSLELLQRASDGFLANRGDCISCHHQNLPAVAFGWARERGFPIDGAAMDRMIRGQKKSWSEGSRLARVYEMDKPVPVPARFLGWGFLGFGALGVEADEITEAMSWYLARTQEPDGHWEAGDLDRPPMGIGNILATVLAARSLQLYPPRGRPRAYVEELSRAKAWLERAKPDTLQERVFRALGLSWLGAPAEELRGESEALAAAQRAEGGWSQLPGMQSDAWATGATLVTLRAACGMPAEDEVYRRGLAFLLRTQFDDGSWFVASRTWPFQQHFDSGFPHGRDQWISAPATAWAAMAMLLAIDPADGVVAGPWQRSEDATGDSYDNDKNEAIDPAAVAEGAGAAVDFSRGIAPLLERSCIGCHGGEKPKGGLSLESRESVLRGGESGTPAIRPGASGASLLPRVATGAVEDLEMPPPAKRNQFPALSADEVQRLRDWIDAGAPWAEE